MSDYYIVNLSHHRREQLYITVWRPDCKGYAWPLSWAGRYSEAEVRSHLGYYNSGENIAVPCHILDEMAIAPLPGQVDNDAGPVVPSNAATWKQVLEHVIAKPTFSIRPRYPRVHKAVEAEAA